MITHEKAKEILLTAKNKKVGKPLGGEYYLVKHKDSFLVVKNHKTFLTITKSNEYKLGLVDSKSYSWMNKFIPGKLKLISKELFYGNVPYFQGMTLLADGDVKIEDAWSRNKEYDLICVDCHSNYSTKRCESCVEDYIYNLEDDADECEVEGDEDDFDDDYQYGDDDYDDGF